MKNTYQSISVKAIMEKCKPNKNAIKYSKQQRVDS